VPAALLCWNVAGRVARVQEQLARIAECAPDIVCLQEISSSTAPVWQAGLRQAGWSHIEIGPTQPGRAARRTRLLCVLTAARVPFTADTVPGVPWPERVLAARIGPLEVVNLHSPISQRPGLVKVLAHEAVHAYLAAGQGPRILCGDLNTPRREQPDGTVWTFARTRSGRLRPERGERWDNAELALIKGLEPLGFRDGFRTLHGYEHREPSWVWPRTGGGYRLDHLIVSSEIEVHAISYLHGWRDDGLSDHSPLLASVTLT
jgi:exonuclease III